MDETRAMAEDRIRIALRQQLESLHRAGITHLKKPAVLPVATESRPQSASRTPRGDANGEPSAASTRRQSAAVDAVPDTAASPAPAKPIKAEANAPAVLAALPADSLPPEQRVHELTVLSQQIVPCTACPELVAHRTQTVFGVGNPQARLCFLGEGPGADEDRQGEPFVGRAGQLLNKIIEACTLHRDEVYILNVVKCRPPGNRNPTPEEIANCRPFFERQLEIIQPEYICCLGAIAAQSLLETREFVSKLRGKFHPWRNSKVVVTYHPAYLLRNPAAKRMVWEDMQMLMRDMGIKLPRL